MTGGGTAGGGFVAIGQILRQWRRCLDRRQIHLLALQEALREAVGPDLAARLEVVGLRNGVAKVAAVDAATKWALEGAVRAGLVARLREQLPHVPINRIKVVLKSEPMGPKIL